MSEKEYIKVSLSKCCKRGHRDYRVIRFTCIVCDYEYSLDGNKTCNGIICCECSGALKYNHDDDEYLNDYFKKIEKESYDILEMMMKNENKK